MKSSIVLIQKNKKAYFDYDIIETFEGGILLKGYEVKSIRNKHINLKGSFVICRGGELFVKNMHISPWKSLVNKSSIDSFIERKILLHKKDVISLCNKVKTPGYSLTILEIYFKGSLIKVKVGLVKGRKKYEKKQILKERDLDKQAKILLKKFY